MTAGAGTVRSAASLERTGRPRRVARRGATDDSGRPGPKSWEATNLLHLGRALTRAAAHRAETRGGHVREDFPARDDERFLHHLTTPGSPDPGCSSSTRRLDLEGPRMTDARLPPPTPWTSSRWPSSRTWAAGST